MRLASFAPASLLLSLALPSSAHAQSSAVYEVRFDATWSSSTHPSAYPSGAHFSPLIGGTHSGAVHLWMDGGIASAGMESMAETGATTQLRNEVEAAIAAGNAGEVITGAGTSSPGQVVTTLNVTSEFHLATIVTMVAPSPDWFVGVDGLDLMNGGQWVASLVVDLYAWDAGTDSGTDFNSSNQDTNPQIPIALITAGPFFGQVPLGTFTFTRISECSPVKYCNPADGSVNNLAGIDISGCDLSNAIRVDLSNGPAGQTAYLLISDGSTLVSPPIAAGDLCVTGGNCLGRYTHDAGAISSSGDFTTDISDSNSGGPGYGIPTCGGNIMSGDTWQFQYWHRQPMGNPSTFSEAISVTFN